MKIITAITPKGGVGKTILCFSLGKFLHDKGYKVLMLDSDDNLSLYNSYQDRLELIGDNAFPEVVTFKPPKVGLERMLNTVGKGYDFVIVDTCGAIEEFHKSLIFLTDLAFVPVTPHKSSLGSAFDTIEYIEDAQLQVPTLSYGIVKVNFDRKGTADRKYLKMVDAEKKPMFDTILYNYSRRYKDAAMYGLSITELDKFGNKQEREASETAVIQMRNWCKECLEILGEVK